MVAAQEQLPLLLRDPYALLQYVLLLSRVSKWTFTYHSADYRCCTRTTQHIMCACIAITNRVLLVNNQPQASNIGPTEAVVWRFDQ